MTDTHGMTGLRRGALAAAITLFLCPAAWAEAYRLAPGDSVRAQIIGLNNEAYASRVDATGNIRFPYLGTHRAAGKTLDELIEDITVATAGRQVELREGGFTTVFVLDEDDIFLDIDAYRPVTVIGAVGGPGRLEFEPGMTVRAAIGISGGVLLGAQSSGGTQLSSMRVRLEELRQTEAWLLADLWQSEALLLEADPEAPPAEYADRLEAQLSEGDVAVLRARIAGALEQHQRDRDDLVARIDLSEAQIEFLRLALEQYETASVNEESRLQDLLNLANRGLATANAVDDARAAALNMSSRLLTTQADLAEAEREFQALQQDKLEIDAVFRQKQLEDKLRIEQSLDENRARLRAIRGELALGALLEEAEEGTSGYRIVLHRRQNGAEISQDVSLGTLVNPGDVIEVLFEEG